MWALWKEQSRIVFQLPSVPRSIDVGPRLRFLALPSTQAERREHDTISYDGILLHEYEQEDRNSKVEDSYRSFLLRKG